MANELYVKQAVECFLAQRESGDKGVYSTGEAIVVLGVEKAFWRHHVVIIWSCTTRLSRRAERVLMLIRLGCLKYNLRVVEMRSE